MKYIYSTSQMSKLSLTLHTFSITGSGWSVFNNRDFRLESILEFIEIDCEVVDMEEGYVPFMVNCDIGMISGVVHTRGESPQERLGVVWSCRTTLASAYVLHCLFAT